MKVQRHGAVLGLVAVSALLLSACGSDNNTPSGSGGTATNAASQAECGGKAKLKASGSSAQANAMTRFVTQYESQGAGQSLDYNSNGSGAGVKEFNGKQTDFGGSDSPP